MQSQFEPESLHQKSRACSMNDTHTCNASTDNARRIVSVTKKTLRTHLMTYAQTITHRTLRDANPKKKGQFIVRKPIIVYAYTHIHMSNMTHFQRETK